MIIQPEQSFELSQQVRLGLEDLDSGALQREPGRPVDFRKGALVSRPWGKLQSKCFALLILGVHVLFVGQGMYDLSTSLSYCQ